MNTKQVIVNIIFILAFLINLASSKSVIVNITSIDPNNREELPQKINVTFIIDTNSTVQLQMTRVEHIKCNIPIYTLDNGLNGLEIHREDDVSNENVAFYQDMKNEAVIQLTRQNISEQQTEITITRGEYVYDGVRYSIQPSSRVKREASDDDSQSDQRYDIKPVPPKKGDTSDYRIAKGRKLPEPMQNQRSRLQDLPKRQKRMSSPTYYIDVTAVLHKTNYDIFLKRASNNPTQALAKAQEYYAFIFSGMDLIYQNFNESNFKLRVKLTKLVIITDSTTLPLTFAPAGTTKVDTDALLDKLKELLNSPTGRDLYFPNDHAMAFVGADLWSPDSDLLGLAFTGTLCTSEGDSSSVIEDYGDYTSITTAAHELGHSLSAMHDGENNTCKSEDGFLMSPADVAAAANIRQNPWRFSICTIDYFISYITPLADTASGLTCLSQTLPVVGNFPDVSLRLLGQEIPPNQQCQLKYGATSSQCEMGKPLSDICMELYCVNPTDAANCVSQAALSGTSCGTGKICNQGACIDDNITNMTTSTTVSTTITVTPCVDDPSFTTDGVGCKSAMLQATNVCYNTSIQKSCCESCSARHTNVQGCEYGDRDSNVCKTNTTCVGRESQCCQTCAHSSSAKNMWPRGIWYLAIYIYVIYLVQFKITII